MSRNGSGVFSLVSGNPVSTGSTISSTWANNTLSDIATALTQSIATDGQSVITQNIPMNSKKITGLAAGTTSGDALSYGQGSMGPISGTTISGTTGTFTGDVSFGTKQTTTAQPFFQARRASDQTSGSTVLFDVVDVNRGSIYASGTGLMTVATAGVYLINVIVTMTNTGGSTATYALGLYKNATEYVASLQSIPNNGSQTFYFNIAMQLAASDTVGVTLSGAFSANGRVSGGASQHNSFSAYLLG